MLADLKEKAEDELSEARKAESKAKHSYDMMKQSLEDSPPSCPPHNKYKIKFNWKHIDLIVIIITFSFPPPGVPSIRGGHIGAWRPAFVPRINSQENVDPGKMKST